MTDDPTSNASPPTPPAAPEPRPAQEQQYVPIWLAALVLVLLLAVVGLVGYVARGLLADDTDLTPQDYEVQVKESELAQDPDDPSLHLALGFAYQQAGRHEDALAEYDIVLESWPADTAALYNKGVVLLELGEYASAEEVLWDVLETDPEHTLAAKALGEYYAGREEYRSLIRAVGPVADTQESSADLQYLMGLAHENLGNPDRAEAYYRLALKYYPDMPEAREGLERLGVAP